jgi:hypothetical protein
MVTKRSVLQVHDRIESAVSRLEKASRVAQSKDAFVSVAILSEIINRDLKSALSDLEYMMQVADWHG